ncbi:hypothetical protein [Bosea sp. LC85]|uniref:hypothetical protein n=1 Tax=Bosea sp. LC85 TaxID=1502851 RepID=UPI001269A22D|nr:hypothetical protein [Bosea sp. LC85]
MKSLAAQDVSLSEIARRFGIGKASVLRILKARKETAQVSAKEAAGPPSLHLETSRAVIPIGPVIREGVMPHSTDLPFDGVLSGLRAGLAGVGVALEMELTSQAGEAKSFTVRLYPEDAKRLSSILAEAASIAEMGKALTKTRQ